MKPTHKAKQLIVVILTALSTLHAHAQDPGFTQFYANPLYLNPALTGVGCPRFVLNYRNQWPGISGHFVTESASYDQRVTSVKGGLGMLVTHDNAGDGIYRTTNVSGLYAYELPVNRVYSIRAGFQATFANKKLDWERLNFGDQIDNKRGFVLLTNEKKNLETRSYFDVSSGIVLYSNRLYAGFAMHHLTEPDEGFIGIGTSPLPTKYTGHAGLRIVYDNNGEDMIFSPNIIYQEQQDFKQINLGAYLSRGPITGGVWYRGVLKDKNDSFILLLGVQQKSFRLGYSYDLTISKLASATAGSHELSVTFELACKPVSKRYRTISCPSF